MRIHCFDAQIEHVRGLASYVESCCSLPPPTHRCHRRSDGLKALLIHSLADNSPMLSLARRVGMTVEILRGEADGRLTVRAGTAKECCSDSAFEKEGMSDYRALLATTAASYQVQD